MSTNNLIQTSFANGELSPTVFGREDLPKIRAGAATMRNFFVDYRGGASTRPGLKFIGAVRADTSPVRLIAFQFSVVQSHVLVFGDYYMRVIADEGFVLETASNVTGSDGTTAQIVQSWAAGDWIYFSSNKRTYIVQAQTPTSVIFINLDGSAATDVPPDGGGFRYYTLPTPWPAAQVFELKYSQSADVLTITHPSYPPYDIIRLGYTNWTINRVFFGSWNSGPDIGLAVPTTVAKPGDGDTSNDAFYSYVITAVNASGEEGLPSSTMNTYAYNMGVDAEAVNVNWQPVAGADHYNVYRAAAYENTQVPAGAIFGYAGQAYGVSFNDCNITVSFTKTPPEHYDPFAPGQITEAALQNAGTGYSVLPHWTVADPTGTGFYGRLVVDQNNKISGFVILNPGSGYTNPVMTITDTTGTGAVVKLSVSPNSGTWPSSVTYFQQRRVFAGSNNFPATLWGTKPGTISNMDTSNPIVDSDSFQFTLASNQVNNIKWMVPMPGGLIVFTGSGVWQLSGGSQYSALTPSTAQAQPQAYTGCADVPPIAIDYSLLFVQESGAIVRDLSYNVYANIYTGLDTTVLSNHLFYGHSIVDWAFAREPYKLIWAVREDGMLLSMTYLKEQEIIGWSRHDTAGIFESVAVIPSADGSQNMAYFVVRRLINGVWHRYVEMIESRDFSTGFDSPWCVDSGYAQFGGTQAMVEGFASAATGTIGFKALGQFSPASVGQILRFGGGRGVVIAYGDVNNITVALDQPITATLGNGMPTPSLVWGLSPMVSVVDGIWHLEGQSVVGLADGIVIGPLTVTNGRVVLPAPASRIVLGLPFTAQLQSMYLEAGGGPTIQGKRKQIQAATTRMVDTRGLKIGPDFNNLQVLPNLAYGGVNPIALLSTDDRMLLPGGWTMFGQVCYQQDQPLPATVTATLFELNLGD